MEAVSVLATGILRVEVLTPRRMIPIHQTLLTVIIFIGFYNVLRVVLAHFDCTSSNQFGLMNLRDHRTALRPWTEEQWQEALTWMLVSPESFELERKQRN